MRGLAQVARFNTMKPWDLERAEYRWRSYLTGEYAMEMSLQDEANKPKSSPIKGGAGQYESLADRLAAEQDEQ